ncbi:unnamed protein product [Natator depressus]
MRSARAHTPHPPPFSAPRGERRQAEEDESSRRAPSPGARAGTAPPSTGAWAGPGCFPGGGVGRSRSLGAMSASKQRTQKERGRKRRRFH